MAQTPEPGKENAPISRGPSDVTPESPLTEGEFSNPPLSLEYLENSDTDRLHGILERALEDTGSLNSLIDLCNTLCEDPSDALNEFRARICQALALSLEMRVSRFDDESCKQLGKLLVVAHYVFEANATNPSWYKPPSLTLVLGTCLKLLAGLAIDQEIPSWAYNSNEARTPEPDVKDRAWGYVYLQCFDPLIVGFDLGVVQLSPVLLDGVKYLVDRQLEWKQKGLSPLECNNEIVIDVWKVTFSLVEKLGDSSFADRMLEEVQELRGRNSGSEGGFSEAWSDKSDEFQFRPVIEDGLKHCEYQALHALAACQYNLDPVPLWKEILAESAVTSESWRKAFIALADLDMSETNPYLVSLLDRLGTSGSQDEKKRTVLGHRLMQFLDKSPAVTACVQVFDPTEKFHVEPALREPLKSIFEGMIAQPKKKWSPKAVKNLEYVSAEIERRRP